MSLAKRIASVFKRKKVNIFLLFLLLALLFSVLTKLSKDYTQTVTFKLEPINIPEDKLIVSDSTHFLKVDLRTYGFKLLRYYFSKPVVQINLANLDKDETHYIWTEKKAFSEIVAQFDPNVKIENINPDTLKFRYDTNTVKRIPVVLNSDVNFSAGFDVVGNFKVVPDSVRIIGPNVLVDSIHSISTQEIVLDNIKSDISKTVKLKPLNNKQLRLSQDNVRLEAKIDKFTEGIVDVPIIVKNVPNDVNVKIYPKTIPVVYYSSLSDFNDISKNSFIIECDYSTKQQNKTYLVPYLIQKPDNIKSAKLSINKVEFIIAE